MDMHRRAENAEGHVSLTSLLLMVSYCILECVYVIIQANFVSLLCSLRANLLLCFLCTVSTLNAC